MSPLKDFLAVAGLSLLRLPGHNAIKTAEIYAHVSASAFNKIKNPLDEPI